MERLSILGSVLLLVLAGIVFSGCLGDDEDEAKVDCAEVFCIGTLLSEEESFNASLIEAVDLAKSDINKAGGNIEIISGNSFPAGAETGEAAASAARLHEMGVHGIVGPSYSSDSREVFPFLVENKMVAVSPSATSPTLTDLNKKIVDAGSQHFFFRVSPSDLFQAPILAKQTRGSTVIVNRDDAWGEPLARIVKENIMSDGREVGVVSYVPPEKDSNYQAASVVSTVEMKVQEIGDVSSIVMLVFNEGGEITRGLLDSTVIPEGTGYYAGDGFPFETQLFPLVEEENGEIEGFKRVTPSPLPGKRFEEFEARLDSDNSIDYAAHAYDAVVILGLAALSAGSNDPSDYVSGIEEVTRGGTKCYSYATCAAALTDETAINDDIDYEGLSGPADLNEYGDIEDGFYAVYTYDAKGEREETYFNFEGEEIKILKATKLR